MSRRCGAKSGVTSGPAWPCAAPGDEFESRRQSDVTPGVTTSSAAPTSAGAGLTGPASGRGVACALSSSPGKAAAPVHWPKDNRSDGEHSGGRHSAAAESAGGGDGAGATAACSVASAAPGPLVPAPARLLGVFLRSPATFRADSPRAIRDGRADAAPTASDCW